MSADYKLLQGNAYDLLHELPPESVDTVLTDPPFGVTRNDWDKALDFDVFWAEIRRVIKPGGGSACVRYGAVLFGPCGI